MNTQTSHVPSITEINQAVELAKRERSKYIAEKTSALSTKLSTFIRSTLQSTTGKVFSSHSPNHSPSH
ncbi:hypothetical protein [Marinobacter salexigens]|uniref:hypothetical protein n=1 Tax=Marinobacter salexigens TaxID=1925763 RepID=UPI000C294829|nr:hypothetical protein [Marinobacter salexigens]